MPGGFCPLPVSGWSLLLLSLLLSLLLLYCYWYCCCYKLLYCYWYRCIAIAIVGLGLWLVLKCALINPKRLFWYKILREQCMDACVVSFSQPYTVWWTEWNNTWLHALCRSASHTLYARLDETIHGRMYCVIQPIIHCMRDWMKQYMAACIVSFSQSYTVWGTEWNNTWLHVLCHSANHTLYDWLNETIHGCIYSITQSLIHCIRDWMKEQPGQFFSSK